MRWQTGIVMETIGRYVVVMTPQGEFKRIRTNGRIPEIGEEIRVPVNNGILTRVSNVRWLAVAASIILLMIASPLLTIMTQPPEVAVAYVTIDINPSVELTVSNHDNVLEAKAYNADGTRVLADLNIKGINYKKAVSQIGKKAIELGYISKSSANTFVISLSPIPNVEFDKAEMESTLLASANEVLSESMVKGEFKAIQVPVALRERANQKGISTAKYAVLLEAVVNAGLAVTEKDMQEKSIEVAIASAGGEPEEIINQAQAEDKFEDKEKVYIALLNKNSTIAMEQTGGEDSGKDVHGEDNNGIVEEKTSDEEKILEEEKISDEEKQNGNKKPLVETVRKTNDPEGSEENVTASGAPAKTDTSEQEPKPAQTTGDQNDNATGDSNNTDNVEVIIDDNTEENYMGSPVESGEEPESNTDMYILKPNF